MKDRTCQIEWCSSPIDRKGLCTRHYTQQWRHGRIIPKGKERPTRRFDPSEKVEIKCPVCEETYKIGLPYYLHRVRNGKYSQCHKCSHKLRVADLPLNKKVEKGVIEKLPDGSTVHWGDFTYRKGGRLFKVLCREGCQGRKERRCQPTSLLKGKGLCISCAMLRHHNGGKFPEVGDKRHTSTGYTDIYLGANSPECLHSKAGWVPEHRAVWLAHFPEDKEKLADGFHVHHKDGNQTNNLIENLALLSRSDHTKYTSRLSSRLMTLLNNGEIKIDSKQAGLEDILSINDCFPEYSE